MASAGWGPGRETDLQPLFPGWQADPVPVPSAQEPNPKPPPQTRHVTPPDPAGGSSTPGWHQKGPEVHFHLLSDCPATPGGPERAGTFGGPEVLLSTAWGK